MGETVRNPLARLDIGEQARRLQRELGLAGIVALVMLSMTALFHKVALEPLQGRAQQLSSGLERQAGKGGSASVAAGSAAKLEAFYSHLGRDESTTDWLAKLYAIGKATGVELQSGTYRNLAAAEKAPARIERYEIVLPVSGSYVQMRDFLRRALGEIPVLSLDQMTLKRESRNDGAVQAELKFTIHMVKK